MSDKPSNEMTDLDAAPAELAIAVAAIAAPAVAAPVASVGEASLAEPLLRQYLLAVGSAGIYLAYHSYFVARRLELWRNV